MKRDLMVILDNSMYSINKDYAGGRFGCQMEAVKRLVSGALAESSEATIGLMTIGRGVTTKIVSPIGDRNLLYSYLHTIRNDSHMAFAEVVPIAQMALKFRTGSAQTILLFLGSPIAEEAALASLLSSIEEALEGNIAVRVMLFGEAMEYYDAIKKKIEPSSDFTCIAVSPSDDFVHAMHTVLREDGGHEEEMDPDLALAIKLSLEQNETPGSDKQMEAEGDTEEMLLQEAIRKSREEADK